MFGKKLLVRPWYETAPYVHYFLTMDGLTHYAKRYLPNVYDRLCFMQTAPHFSQVVSSHFRGGGDVEAYLSMLWLWVMDYPPHDDADFEFGWASQTLILIERHCRGDRAVVETYAQKCNEWRREWNPPRDFGVSCVWPMEDDPDNFHEFAKQHDRKFRL